MVLLRKQRVSAALSCPGRSRKPAKWSWSRRIPRLRSLQDAASSRHASSSANDLGDGVEQRLGKKPMVLVASIDTLISAT